MVELVVVLSTLVNQFSRGREKQKLRTVYPCRLNEKVDICEDDKNVKRFESDDSIVGKLFPTLLDYFKGIKHIDMSTGKE